MSGPDGGILVVCAANVCRSPMTEFAIRRALGARADFEGVVVSSAGVRVDGPRSACQDVIDFRNEPMWQELGSLHVSRALEHGMIQDAALVVTATREQRSMVVAEVPECRSSVFTLREALWLGKEYERDASTPPAHAVAAFREHIDSMRGLRPLPTPRRHRLWPRADHDPLDISDGHGARARAHHEAMRAALAVGNELAERIAGGDH